MPELPEVEATRRSFADAIVGARVQGLWLGKPLRWPLGCVPQALVGLRVLGVRRRGKYLLIDLERGLLLLHLGMSGSLRFAMNLPPPGGHDHFDLVTSHGTLRLHDPRRFGAVVYAPSEQHPAAQKLLAGLGVEPLSEAFTVEQFACGLRKSRAPIKQVLLAGRLVVGVGNIYANEALFLAGIRPTTPAMRLGLARVRKLHAAIREVLAQAIALGGTTLRNFSNAAGAAGHFQHATQVYGRADAPCRVCGAPIRWIQQGQRSSYFCPRCQRA